MVQQLAVSLCQSGRRVVTGCCNGADAAAVSALAGVPALSVFAIFDRHGRGAWAGSSVSRVGFAASLGSQVAWLAGGPLSLRLGVRLARRTAAVAATATAGACVFFQGPQSRGSALLARLVAARGLPVVGVAVGFGARALPPLGAGSWVTFTAQTGAQAAVWVPAQQSLL